MSAVHSDNIALTQNLLVAANDRLLLSVDAHVRGAHHAGQAKTAPDHSGMARDPAAFRENRNHRVHPANIFRPCFSPHQNSRLAACSTGLRVRGCKDDLSSCRPRACGNALGQYGARCIGCHLSVQQFGQCLWVNPHKCIFARYDAVAGQVHGNMDRRA